MMLNEEQFADFLTSEIEKHVRAGMESVLKKVEDRLNSSLTNPVLPDFQKMIDDAMDLIAKPEKGEKGEKGDAGENGKDGKDGVSPSPEDVAKSLEGHFYKWVLDFERKAYDKLENAINKLEQPKDGKDGRDAISIDGFDLSVCPDLRTIKVCLSDGEKTIEKEVKIPSILDRGVYSSTKQYEQGDAVTYAGGIFIAQVDNPSGYPETSKDWRLAVKRGRDGRESVKIERKIETVKVKNAGNTTTGK